MLSENLKLIFLVVALVYSLSLVGVPDTKNQQKTQESSHDILGADSEIPHNPTFEPLDTCLCDHGLIASASERKTQGLTCKCKSRKDTKCICGVCECNHCNK